MLVHKVQEVEFQYEVSARFFKPFWLLLFRGGKILNFTRKVQSFRPTLNKEQNVPTTHLVNFHTPNFRVDLKINYININRINK